MSAAENDGDRDTNEERAGSVAEVWEVVNGGQTGKPRDLDQVLKPGFGAGWRQRRS